MILNSVFLIYKDKVSDFMDILNALKELFENKGIFFDCTGPWPPYNFCLQEKAKNGKKPTVFAKKLSPWDIKLKTLRKVL